MGKLENKKILITGASSGIGKVTAALLSQRKARLILVARSSKKLLKVASEITTKFQHLPYPTCLTCDVTKPEEVEAMIRICQKLFGNIDVLINNAGYGVYGESELTSLEDFREVMDVNFFGAINCMYGVLQLMKRSGKGHIINIASVAALHGVPYLSAYGASKAALASVSQSLRAELHDTSIQISIIYPGYTETNFFKKEKKVGRAFRPKGPYMPAEKVAEVIEQTILRNGKDQVIGWEGKTLMVLKNLFPGLVNGIMKDIAMKLK